MGGIWRFWGFHPHPNPPPKGEGISGATSRLGGGDLRDGGIGGYFSVVVLTWSTARTILS